MAKMLRYKGKLYAPLNRDSLVDSTHPTRTRLLRRRALIDAKDAPSMSELRNAINKIAQSIEWDLGEAIWEYKNDLFSEQEMFFAITGLFSRESEEFTIKDYLN